MKTTETILKSCFLALLIFGLFYLNITSNAEVQKAKEELATYKLNEKFKCDQRYLGIGK
jgi:hypothetical protein